MDSNHQETIFANKTARNIFFLVLLIGIVGYFSGLFIDVTRDAGKYATASKEIFQNGNFINLTIHGDAYDQKPPMTFWLGALGFSVGGVSNFWFKFPIFLLVMAGFYWAYRLGRSLYNHRVGLLTAIFLAFSEIYVLYSMDIHTDTVLQAFVTLALWQLFEFIKTRKNKHWIIGFAAIGLAMLSKGPIGAAIPAFAVVGHILLKRDFKFLFDYRWFLGILLAFAVASPALIGLMNQFGWRGIWFFFWENNVGRITGSYVHSTNDPIFYVHSLLYLFFPWSLLFFVAVFYEFRSLLRNKFRSVEYFTFTGIWIFFIILNAANSQLPNYVFAIVPLIAVLTAKWVNEAMENRQQIFRVFLSIQNVVASITWLLAFTLLVYLFPMRNLFIWLFTAVMFGFGLFIFLKVKDKGGKLLLPVLIAFSTLTVILNTHVLPYMFSFQAPPKAAQYFNENRNEGDTLYNFHYPQYELFFYSEPQALQLKSTESVKAASKNRGTWLFTDEEGFSIMDELQIKGDTLLKYEHLYLNRPARFINPKTRNEVLKPMYLIRF